MRAWCAVCVLVLTVFPPGGQQPSKAQVGIAGVLESKVRKAWEALPMTGGAVARLQFET